MHDNEELCLESSYDKALDDKNYNTIESGFNPTIFEMDRNYVLVDHEKPVLSVNYIVEFVHDATENYYERGKYGCRSSHVTKTPLFMLKVLKFTCHTFLCLMLCAPLIYFLIKFLCIGRELDLNVFDNSLMMLSLAFQ